MTTRAKPPAEIAIDASLIRTLLAEQHPDLAHLALVDIGEGWDNRLFRLGNDLAVRIHGDLHPGNLLVSGGRLSAVIDFGDLAAGDPATDLSVLWMLPSPARSTLLESARGKRDPVDDDTLMRARGWALALGLAYLAHSRDDEPMAALGRATIDAALKHDAPSVEAS